MFWIFLYTEDVAKVMLNATRLRDKMFIVLFVGICVSVRRDKYSSPEICCLW